MLLGTVWSVRSGFRENVIQYRRDGIDARDPEYPGRSIKQVRPPAGSRGKG